MSIANKLKSLTDEELLDIADNYTSARAYLRSIGLSSKGQYGAIINNRLNKLGLEWVKPKNTITKICPVCDKEFESYKGSNETTTCSYSCSNTHFRTGSNHPNFNGNNYRIICFEYHKKECVICGENNIVAVHHLNENSSDNSPENLIPLCPTHHAYWHSSYKHLIEGKINQYIRDWVSG